MKLPEGAVFTYITPDALLNKDRVMEMLDDCIVGIAQMEECVRRGDLANVMVKSQVASFNLRTLSEELALMISS